VVVSSYLAIIIESVCSFLVGVAISFFYSWRISLTALAVSPIIVIAGFIDAKINMG